jgi:hypothetical protein
LVFGSGEVKEVVKEVVEEVKLVEEVVKEVKLVEEVVEEVVDILLLL